MAFKSASNQLVRLAAVLFLGFTSGLPLALTGQAMQAWLAVDGVDIATIGFLGLVGIPYTFKFLWAPLMDRFEPPWLGRRRGWLVLTQLALAAALIWLSGLSIQSNAALFALAALTIAFLSASQDVVVDAYRTDILTANERGLGGSLSVFGYRLAMILSGGISLIWAEQWQSWPQVYLAMAGIMATSALLSLLLLPGVSGESQALDSSPKRELTGFFAMLAGFVVGWFAARLCLSLMGLSPDSPDKWLRLLFLLAQLAAALPLGYWAARRVGFETLNRSLDSYFAQSGALAFLFLIILYKLGDAFAGSLTTPFLIKGMGFSQAEVGIVNKIIGLWLTIAGALAAGALMLHLSLYRALMWFGILQLVSNFGFWLLAISGRGAWGSVILPSFDLGFVALDKASEIDLMLVAAIAFENVSGGMGTAAFVALLMGLCNHRFTATHYALLSAFAAVGRIYVSPLSGVMSETIGWPGFFVFSVFMAVPGLLAVWWMRHSIARLNDRQAQPI